MLYDGVCGLCHRAVSWLLAHDRRGAFHYAPLQGETAAALRRLHPEIPSELATMVLVEDGRVHLRARAVLHAARHLGAPWRWVAPLRHLPAFLLDPFYWIVAKTRYRIFGKFDQCRLPSAKDRSRLLP
jgi:predicted DCC family thiol-disulfide oxidoreductase YuxK